MSYLGYSHDAETCSVVDSMLCRWKKFVTNLSNKGSYFTDGNIKIVSSEKEGTLRTKRQLSFFVC